MSLGNENSRVLYMLPSSLSILVFLSLFAFIPHTELVLLLNLPLQYSLTIMPHALFLATIWALMIIAAVNGVAVVP